MNRRRWPLWLGIVIAGQVWAQGVPQGPLEVIRVSNGRVQSVLRSHETLDGPTKEDLFRIIEGVTDFGEISRRVVEPFCKRLSDSECARFDRTFQLLLRASSLRKLGRYRADRFEYLGEDIDGETAIVRTLAFYEEETFRLNYLLERSGGRWLIINYIVDDVDTIRNYKKQFLRLFARSDFQGIIARLEKKIAEYEEE
jgi:phospholipid transport system substrate-binding protein